MLVNGAQKMWSTMNTIASGIHTAMNSGDQMTQLTLTYNIVLFDGVRRCFVYHLSIVAWPAFSLELEYYHLFVNLNIYIYIYRVSFIYMHHLYIICIVRLSARWATELLWQPPEECICEIVEMLCVWNVSYCIFLETFCYYYYYQSHCLAIRINPRHT